MAKFLSELTVLCWKVQKKITGPLIQQSSSPEGQIAPSRILKIHRDRHWLIICAFRRFCDSLRNSKSYPCKWLHPVTLLEDGFLKRKTIFSIISYTVFPLKDRYLLLLKEYCLCIFRSSLLLAWGEIKNIPVEYQCIMSSAFCGCLGNSAGSLPCHSGLRSVEMTEGMKVSLWFWQCRNEKDLIGWRIVFHW